MFAIEICDIRKCFGNNVILNNLNFNIISGEFFGLLGLNGAGKTTLINIISGLVKSDSGTIFVNGYDISKYSCDIKRMIGVVPQELVFDPFFTVYETLKIQSSYFGLNCNKNWIFEIMKNLHLVNKSNSYIRSLSGGMKRRVMIAQALVHHPSIIILDEPTAGVDVELRKILWKFILRLNNEGITVILTTHYLQEAETLCNRVAMLCNGNIIALDDTKILLNRFKSINIFFRFLYGNFPLELEKFRIKSINNILNKNEYILKLSNYNDIEYVLSKCISLGCCFDEIEIRKPNLEDIFLYIMKNKKI